MDAYVRRARGGHLRWAEKEILEGNLGKNPKKTGN